MQTHPYITMAYLAVLIALAGVVAVMWWPAVKIKEMMNG